jgi:hypothetical protein
MIARIANFTCVWQINESGHPALSDAQIRYLAGRGGWLINAELHQTPIDREVGNGDCSVCAGQGVPDLDRVQSLMDRYPWGRFSVDVGGPSSTSAYIYIGTNDMNAWRDDYKAQWGDVEKPQYWSHDVQSLKME